MSRLAVNLQTITKLKLNTVDSTQDPEIQAFRFTVDTGCRMLSSHEKIVVHCSSGRGRAPLIIAAIICKMQGYEQSMMSCYEMVGGRLEQAGRKVFWYKKGAKRHLLPLAQEWYTLAKNGTYGDVGKNRIGG